MANPMKGEAEVKLDDGRTLKLAFNANAWIEAEDALGGRPTPDILEELQSGKASLKTQRAVMFGGLRKHHPEITIEMAGELLIEAASKMAEAITGGLPQGKEGAPADDGERPLTPPAKAGRGTASATPGLG